MKPSRAWPIVAALALLLLVNLPLGHLAWTDHQLDARGVPAVGHVTETHPIRDTYFVTFRLPASLDADQAEYAVEVPESTYEQAERTGRLDVVHLPDDPSTNRAVAQSPTGSVAIWLTVLANLAVLAILGLMLWSRRHGMLVLEATEDLTRCKPDDTVTELGGGTVLVRGDVHEIHDDYIVVLANSDRVMVFLGDHHNPVGHQQPVQLRGRRVGRR